MHPPLSAARWITDREFAELCPRNVFHRQLEPLDLPCDEHRNRHILFRRRFTLEQQPEQALLQITADDYYKLYINGQFVTQGPAPCYDFAYGYNTVDISRYLHSGENLLAVHTLYQGLINRVWVSGDQQHGLWCVLVADGQEVFHSDERFLTHPHTGYRETGIAGYDTQFLEDYDSGALEVGFEQPGFDDSGWDAASLRQHANYKMIPQPTASLAFETIRPVVTERRGQTLFVDFGAGYVGYLRATAKGQAGEQVVIRCGQELLADGTVRYQMRCNCIYEEGWKLTGGEDLLDWFDYKSFRYAELLLPEGCEVYDIALEARHYPFELHTAMRADYANDPDLRRIWDLCVHSQKYGVQEVIQDCMDREKGFYVGDGCYTALTHMILSGDDGIVRKLIDDAFASVFVTPTMVTCLGCSWMQEIAEYPLYLVSLILWHYRLTGDKAYLRQNYPKTCALLEAFRAEYEVDGLLQNMDKWCVVEWPENYQDGYDVCIEEGKICREPHVALNAFYIEAVRSTNRMAELLGEPLYRDEAPLLAAFWEAFRLPDRHLYRDSPLTDHCSYIGNIYTYAFRLYRDDADRQAIEGWIEQHGITGVMLFGSFPLLYGLLRHGHPEKVREFLLDEGAWLRMLREGATTTYEGWGRDEKWNTSLFHLTLSDAAVFLADIDHTALFA